MAAGVALTTRCAAGLPKMIVVFLGDVDITSVVLPPRRYRGNVKAHKEGASGGVQRGMNNLVDCVSRMQTVIKT